MKTRSVNSPAGAVKPPPNNSRPRREGSNAAPNRGSNCARKFDPPLCRAPKRRSAAPGQSSMRPRLPAAKTAAPVGSAKGENTQNAPSSQSRRNAQPGSAVPPRLRGRTGGRSARPARHRTPQAVPALKGPHGAQQSRSARPQNQFQSRRPPAAAAEQRARSTKIRPGPHQPPPAAAEVHQLRRDMNAHGGATAPIEDHSDEV